MCFSSLFSCGVGVNFFVCDAARIYGLAVSWMYLVLLFRQIEVSFGCGASHENEMCHQCSMADLLSGFAIPIELHNNGPLVSCIFQPVHPVRKVRFFFFGKQTQQMLSLKGPRFWIEHDGIVCDKRVLNMPACLVVFWRFNARLQVFPTWFIHKSYFKDLSGWNNRRLARLRQEDITWGKKDTSSDRGHGILQHRTGWNSTTGASEQLVEA